MTQFCHGGDRVRAAQRAPSSLGSHWQAHREKRTSPPNSLFVGFFMVKTPRVHKQCQILQYPPARTDAAAPPDDFTMQRLLCEACSPLRLLKNQPLEPQGDISSSCPPPFPRKLCKVSGFPQPRCVCVGRGRETTDFLSSSQKTHFNIQ